MTSEQTHKVFISADSLLRDSMELARLIVRSDFRPTFLVALWRGGAPIGITVQEVLEYHSIQTDHIAIRTSSYTGIDNQNKVVRVHAVDYLVSQLTAEDELLLVDDVFDSGRSLEAVIAELRRRCRRNLPERIRIATVYYKPARNRSADRSGLLCARHRQLARVPARDQRADARGNSATQACHREFPGSDLGAARRRRIAATARPRGVGSPRGRMVKSVGELRMSILGLCALSAWVNRALRPVGRGAGRGSRESSHAR